MSAIDLSDLEAKARAATLECPGEWRAEFTVHEPEITHHVVDDNGEILATPSAIRDSIGDAAYGAAAAFIAAANPATVLALVAVARAAMAANVSESYGSFYGGDPRGFTPDPECSTEEERARHRAACDAAERGEMGSRELAPDVCKMMGGEGAEPFGLGTTTLALDSRITAALSLLEAL